MTTFNIQICTDQQDTAYVKVNDRFDVAVAVINGGIELRVYPITDGEIWSDPTDVLSVYEVDIADLEAEMKVSP